MPLQTRMEALFDGWKKAFENPGFKFYFVQLSPYNYWFYPDELPEIWEAQEAFAAAHGPEVGMAVINDVGNVNDIHPKNKETVGKRLAMLARKHTYGEKTLKADSPRLVNTRRKANAVRLIFSNVESWRTSDNGPVRHFEIAGSNGIFHPALVKINGRELLVSSDKVAYRSCFAICGTKRMKHRYSMEPVFLWERSVSAKSRISGRFKPSWTRLSNWFFVTIFVPEAVLEIRQRLIILLMSVTKSSENLIASPT